MSDETEPVAEDAAGVRARNRGADWKVGRPCGDYPEEFYAERNRDQKEAAQICQLLCPVQTTCLDYALRADERYGVWGGTTERERERLRKARRKAGLQ